MASGIVMAPRFPQVFKTAPLMPVACFAAVSEFKAQPKAATR